MNLYKQRSILRAKHAALIQAKAQFKDEQKDTESQNKKDIKFLISPEYWTGKKAQKFQEIINNLEKEKSTCNSYYTKAIGRTEDSMSSIENKISDIAAQIAKEIF